MSNTKPKKVKTKATEQDAINENIPLNIFKKRWLILVTLITSLLVVMLSNGSLNLALPSLSKTLELTSLELTWVVEAYALSFAGLLLTAGALGDRYGRKLIMQMGLLLFLGASIYAGFFAETGTELIIARTIMGVGGALVMPTTLSILNVVFPKKERTKAIAIWGAAASAGVMLGSIVSGFLLEHFEWQSVFVFSVVVAAAGLIINQILVVESSDPNKTPVDWFGGILSTTGLVGIVYAIMEAPSHGFTPPITASLVIGLALIGVFIWWEHKAAHPMLDMNLFKKAAFTISTITVTLTFFALMGVFFGMSQMFQLIMEYSPLQSALATIPVILPIILLTPFVPPVLKKIGTRWTVTIGLALITIAFAVMTQWPVDIQYWQVWCSAAILVSGLAFASTPATDMLMASVPKNRSGMGSAVNDTTRELGGALGIAALGAIMSSQYVNLLHPKISALPTELQEIAEKSLSGALGVATQIGPQGQMLVDAAKTAWMNGLTTSMLVACIALGVATLVAAIWLPHNTSTAEDVEPIELKP